MSEPARLDDVARASLAGRRALVTGGSRGIGAGVLSRPGRKVLYCGAGIAATVDALALTLLGESDVTVYDGSLHEWARNPELPLEVG